MNTTTRLVTVNDSELFTTRAYVTDRVARLTALYALDRVDVTETPEADGRTSFHASGSNAAIAALTTAW